MQNKFLQPDAKMVDALVAQLQAKQIGVVAHFYMDPEVQGVLSSAGALRFGAALLCHVPESVAWGCGGPPLHGPGGAGRAVVGR